MVRLATPDDRQQVLDTIISAFAHDPVRWLFPDDSTYPARAAVFFGWLRFGLASGGD